MVATNTAKIYISLTKSSPISTLSPPTISIKFAVSIRHKVDKLRMRKVRTFKQNALSKNKKTNLLASSEIFQFSPL